MAQQALNVRTIEVPEAHNNLLARIGWEISDTLVMTWRNLLYYRREPELLIFSTIQPILFVLLFAYTLGGAIQTGQGDYINYLLPGILVQTVIFGATQTTVGLADDLSKGMVDRFRSLPMSRAAVLAGRTLADSVRNLFVVLLMIAVGTLIGFRFQNGLLNAAAGVALLVLFGYAFSWISALIGLMVRTPEAANVAGFIWVFPLVFASSIFAPTETMPEWLQIFAANQPITVVSNAVRGLFVGDPGSSAVLDGTAWMLLIVVIFLPLAVRQYRRIA